MIQKNFALIPLILPTFFHNKFRIQFLLEMRRKLLTGCLLKIRNPLTFNELKGCWGAQNRTRTCTPRSTRT